jgi:hypothetical protein
MQWVKDPIERNLESKWLALDYGRGWITKCPFATQQSYMGFLLILLAIDLRQTKEKEFLPPYTPDLHLDPKTRVA